MYCILLKLYLFYFGGSGGLWVVDGLWLTACKS